MPQLLRIGPYVVYFWSNENDPLEPVHVHVSKGRPNPNSTKIWITSTGKALLCKNDGKITDRVLNKIIRIIETGDNKAADLRERILKKYIWVMAYHNLVCEFYRKPNFKILTQCNCDRRFLKIRIDVLDNDVEIHTDCSQPET